MKQHDHDVEDGWFLNLGDIYKLTFCSLVANMIAQDWPFMGQQVRCPLLVFFCSYHSNL